MSKYTAEEFYPTPRVLLDKITEEIKWEMVQTVLEPEAGKGDIVDYINEKCRYVRWGEKPDIDCIEIDNDLRCTLKGKGYKVVHDDFLTFHTYKKYDLIIMNPPFSNGATHLLKALEMQKKGGSIICILNAETIRNPYTNERKVLVQMLSDANADISYIQHAFTHAEEVTDVEIAVIKVLFPEEEKVSVFYNELRKKTYAENFCNDINELAVTDYIKALVAMYNVEVESGLRLIEEYKGMAPYIMNDLREENKYREPILQLKIYKEDLSTNEYVKAVRRKYWVALFNNKKFTGNMTSNSLNEYLSEIRKLDDYDFSYYNIKTIQIEMTKNLIKGIEDCIIKLFGELSYQHSYDDEFSSNIHYFNGWKTNKCWYINKKVILPYMDAFNQYDRRFEPTNYYLMQKLMDIEKALNYLDGGLTDGRDMEMWLRYAAKTGQTKKIELKYFYITFYKKGTCHIEFKDAELLKKLNIFGAQNKRWLPPAYGKKKYSDMTIEEQAVIDDFEGKESYEHVIENANYFIYEPKSSLLCLEAV